VSQWVLVRVVVVIVVEIMYIGGVVKIIDSGLYFVFSLFTLFYFLFLEQLGLGFISQAITSVTS